MSKNQAPFWWALFLVACPALAQDDLVTDRPDQTESAVVVPQGTLQVELGLGVGGDEIDDTAEVPGTLVRYGLSRRVEVRLAWPGWIRVESEGGEVSGLGDPELGAKVALRSSPDLAVLAHLSLPWGDDEVGAEDPLPSLRLAGAHALGPRVGLGWNAGLAANSALTAGGRARVLSRWMYTAAVGFDLSDAWAAFVEVFGDFPASDPEPATHSIDGGLTYLLHPRLQLDVAAGAGLNEDAPDWFAGVGISFRVPR